MDEPQLHGCQRREIKQWDLTFRYQLLDRLWMDCEYYLGRGGRLSKFLWAGNAAEQIAYMKALWLSLPQDEKPEWLSFDQICDYETRMREQS